MNNKNNTVDKMTGILPGSFSPVIRPVVYLLLSLSLIACESDNEHFCARYQYVYDQLLEDDVPSYQEMKSQLMVNLNDPKKDQSQTRFMLFVLEDWHSELKQQQETSRDFCMRIKRWQHYQ